MRQEHAAGDKVFVDYSGKKILIVDRKTGDPRGGDLCGGARCIELHLCRGDLDAKAP